MTYLSNSHQNLLIHNRKNICLQLPRHHPNYDIPTVQPPQADHFWHAGEPTPRLSSNFSQEAIGGGVPSGSNPKWSNLGSKLAVSGSTIYTRLFDGYCISICRCLFPKNAPSRKPRTSHQVSAWGFSPVLLKNVLTLEYLSHANDKRTSSWTSSPT